MCPPRAIKSARSGAQRSGRTPAAASYLSELTGGQVSVFDKVSPYFVTGKFLPAYIWGGYGVSSNKGVQ